MHWFWRILIAFLSGLFYGRVIDTNAPEYVRDVSVSLGFNDIGWATGWLMVAFRYIPACLIALLVYALLTRYCHPKRQFLDGETRCRKCQYILRGISEPRCPECGERI